LHASVALNYSSYLDGFSFDNSLFNELRMDEM
jgi:hypothetical protein